MYTLDILRLDFPIKLVFLLTIYIYWLIVKLTLGIILIRKFCNKIIINPCM